MPVSDVFKVVKGGFTSLAGEVDHVARAGLAQLRREFGALTSDVGVIEAAYIPDTLVDAKGDLLVGTAADTVDNLAVGANGLVLAADSSASAGVAWQDKGPVFSTFVPAGNTDYSSGSFGDWVSMGNVTVPTWASSVVFVLTASAIYTVTAVNNLFLIRLEVGSDVSEYVYYNDLNANSQRVTVTLTGEITTLATGSQTLTVQAQRASGTGALRADAACRFSASLWFKP